MIIKDAISILHKYEYSTKLELSEGTRNDICKGITAKDFISMKILAVEALARQNSYPVEFNNCPLCYQKLQGHENYCPNCGQKIHWK